MFRGFLHPLFTEYDFNINPTKAYTQITVFQ
jgi:hypothetical protein